MENTRLIKRADSVKNDMESDFTVECSKIESITADHGMVSIQVKEGYIYPFDCRHVIKTFPDHVLIDEIIRRHPNSSIILNKL